MVDEIKEVVKYNDTKKKWCIMQHETGKELACFDTENEANAHIKRMKMFSKESFECEILEAVGNRFKVRIIKGGTSMNKTYYTEQALDDIVSIINENDIPCKSFKFDKDWLSHLPNQFKDMTKKFSGNVVGWYKNAVRKGADVIAELITSDSAEWIKKGLTVAFNNGIKKPFGLSIDGEGELAPDVIENEEVQRVDRVNGLNSVDIVTSPSAGGEFLAIVESYIKENIKENKMNYLRVYKKLMNRFPEIVKESKDEVSVEDFKSVLEAIAKEDERFKFEVTKDTATEIEMKVSMLLEEDEKKELDTFKASFEKMEEGMKCISESIDKLGKKKEEKKKDEEEVIKEEKVDEKYEEVKKELDEIKESNKKTEWTKKVVSILEDTKGLEDSEKDLIGKYYSEKVDDEKGLREELTSLLKKKEAEKQASEKKETIVNVKVEEGQKVKEAIQASFDHMCGVKDKDGKVVAPAEGIGMNFGGSIKEAYIKMTGDVNVNGRIPYAVGGRSPLHETITTSDFTALLGTSIHRIIVNEYNGGDDFYRKICNIKSANDFKTVTAISLGEYADLSSVSESATYTEFSAYTEETATYSVAKFGNYIGLTIETIKNDDLNHFMQTPKKIGKAANRAVNTFVGKKLLNYVTSSINDGSIYDAIALYHAVSHANTMTGALSSSNFRTARNAMGAHKDLDSELEIGIDPKYLIVPKSETLEATGRIILDSEFITGSSNNDINSEKGMAELLPVKKTFLQGDANNWYLVADPAEYDTIHLAFLDGKEAPELFKQDNPSVGEVWTHDRIAWKVRHIYGGAVIDYRSFYGGLVS